MPARPMRLSGAWLRSNRGVGTLLLLLLLALLGYLLNTDWAYVTARDGFMLGGMPIFGVIVMIGCALSLVFGGSAEVTEDEMRTLGWDAALYALAVVLGSYLYFELAWTLGFVLVTPLTLFGATYLFGTRPWTRALLAGLAMTCVLYAIFSLIGVTLPTGLLPF